MNRTRPKGDMITENNVCGLYLTQKKICMLGLAREWMEHAYLDENDTRGTMKDVEWHKEDDKEHYTKRKGPGLLREAQTEMATTIPQVAYKTEEPQDCQESHKLLYNG